MFNWRVGNFMSLKVRRPKSSAIELLLHRQISDLRENQTMSTGNILKLFNYFQALFLYYVRFLATTGAHMLREI